MALNPIVFTEKVVRSFLRYQVTAYPFADERLDAQLRSLLSLDETRDSPLLKGPYISLSRPFRKGAAVQDLLQEGLLHPHMAQRIPENITHFYGHQEEAIRAIGEGRTTLISTGTGSGKTECFLYPIISQCLELRDENAPPGISAVIVYPMNALAEDQLQRLRSLLAGTGIPFGMYVGKTPEYEHEVVGIRLEPGASRADYEARVAREKERKSGESVYPAEEVCSREVMRTPGKQPRILLTNVKQLELLLTRQKDIELFANARLDFLVFDEAHTFTGAQGAEAACLIRRLRSYCGREAHDTVCVATSATIVDQNNPEAGRDFAARFFGVSLDNVATIGEAYEPEVWTDEREIPPVPLVEPGQLLIDCVRAVDDPENPQEAIQAIYRQLSGESLPPGSWLQALHAALSRNEVVYQLSEILVEPQPLEDLPTMLERTIGRTVSEEEILAWLTLGAAARVGGRPLLRPVVHAFIRGISGGVVSFPEGDSEPRLWLSAEDEIVSDDEDVQHAHFPITTCSTCGQHYFVTYLKDFVFTGREPGGGQASGDGSVWEPLEAAQGGDRVVLLDRIVGDEESEDLESHNRLSVIHFCRYCGAAHPLPVNRCLHCGMEGETVRLYAVQQKEENPGVLTSCLSCGSLGGRMGSRYREPARPLRATNVADVHILAQDMVHHSERPRLLVFCDNRQDAAFQAGWMKDHARRFRLRGLMAEGLQDGPISIGDLTHFIDARLQADMTLSRLLAPEVWTVARLEGTGGRHQQERRKFLRIQVLREATISSRNRIGLEPWGRMKVEYQNLDVTDGWIQSRARQIGLPAEDLREGVASLLDYLRRRNVLYDPEYKIFTKYWMDGDLEVQQGYIPQLGSPTGTKITRETSERSDWVVQWLSSHGDTTIRQMARKWGVAADEAEEFLTSLFELLEKKELLVPVQLMGSRGNLLPNISGVYQVNADLMRLQVNSGVYRCKSCRRRTIRRTPYQKCPAWRCDGELEFLREDPDNYDLQLLDQDYTMLRPEEHTAMVPHQERERLENFFKGDTDIVNAFVCTPTLELGVDIGKLDAILMRNVPPLPANYWQRAGRAGRRHRMAVDFTYCRPVSHDRAYFAEPVKMLAGRVDPPAFNLRNDLLVAKHVHATVITRLHQYGLDPLRTERERNDINRVLQVCLPSRVNEYLFYSNGVVRTEPFDLSPLKRLIESNQADLVNTVERAFSQGWPEDDSEVTRPEVLHGHVLGMVEELNVVIGRLRRRLRWAMEQIRRLNEIRNQKGSLEPEDDALFRRCDRLVKRLKGLTRPSRSEAEGYDDIYTFGVLAAEGFLPGYGLEAGSILGVAEIPHWRVRAMDFVLPRPPSVALREYVPGNLIYANGNRFVARRFHRDVDEEKIDMPIFEVSAEKQAVKELEKTEDLATLGGSLLETIAVCDVDLVHLSHISDDEELRFQLGVSVFGLERGQHNGGSAYLWGERPLHHRRGVRMRLVNVGASSRLHLPDGLGYPLCTVCGQSVSPLSSDRQLDAFAQQHLERCGREIKPVGFYADVVADTLSLPACTDQTQAYSVLEALRFGATRVLDMHLEDLQILVIGHVDRDEVDGLLWDPMPGGSGLLDQICGRFNEIVSVAREVVADCPSLCESSCIDCLQTFHNSYYHKYLNRMRALECLDSWGFEIAISHEIPALQPEQPLGVGDGPVNVAEQKLRHLLLAAGFAEGEWQKQIHLDPVIGTTTPDVFYQAEHHEEDEGICIYLDGLSQHIHGNQRTMEQDRRIREWLRNHGYEVIAISVNELDDPNATTQYFRRLAGYLGAYDLRNQVRDDPSWFDRVRSLAGEVTRFVLRKVAPTPEGRYVGCLPLIPLEAAAGAFGDPQSIDEDDLEWVAVDTSRTLREGMFVARVVGRSMEPRIPDGSYCIFSSPVVGSRNGKTVLVQLRDTVDPETGERYTVKRYESQKSEDGEDIWRHVKITLYPTNPDFEPIELTVEDEGQVRVIAEVVEVIG